MPKRIKEDPYDSDIEREIKELQARAEGAMEEIAEIADEEENQRLADELRQKVEELEAELAQRKQQHRRD